MSQKPKNAGPKFKYPKKMLSDLSIPQGGGSLFNGQQVIAQGSEICKSRTLFELVETKVCGDPRVKWNGTHVERPDAGYFFLKHADSIDVHKALVWKMS